MLPTFRKPVILGAWRPVLALTYRFWPEGQRAKAPNRRSPTSKVIDFVDHPTGFFFLFSFGFRPGFEKTVGYPRRSTAI